MEIEKFLETENQDNEAMAVKGVIEYYLNNMDEAKKCFELVLSKTDNSLVHNNYGVI